jgi:circadian clock protein KaiC
MESAAQLREKGRIFDLHLEEYEQTGLLRIVSLPAHELEADCVADLLRDDIERRGAGRAVLDSAAQLERSIVDVDRWPDFVAALVTYLRGRSITTCLTYERARYGADLDTSETSLAVLAENLLFLRAAERDGRPRRFCSIMHIRFSVHDHRLHEYTIEAGQGMMLGEGATESRLDGCAPSTPQVVGAGGQS